MIISCQFCKGGCANDDDDDYLSVKKKPVLSHYPSSTKPSSNFGWGQNCFHWDEMNLYSIFYKAILYFTSYILKGFLLALRCLINVSKRILWHCKSLSKMIKILIFTFIKRLEHCSMSNDDCMKKNWHSEVSVNDNAEEKKLLKKKTKRRPGQRRWSSSWSTTLDAAWHWEGSLRAPSQCESSWRTNIAEEKNDLISKCNKIPSFRPVSSFGWTIHI